MSKLAIILVLFCTTKLLWHQTEAKPFLVLPTNFFVLTTRAPSTDSRLSSSTSYSSYSTSAGTGGLFQLKTNILSRKLGLISSLLSGFGGGTGSGSGSLGGSFGLGFNLNSGATTRSPIVTSTTEPNTVFTPDVTTKQSAVTTKADIATEQTTVITEKTPAGGTTSEAILSNTSDTTAISVPSIADAKAPTIATTTTTTDHANEVRTTKKSGDGSDGILGSGNFEVLSVGGHGDIQNADAASSAGASVAFGAAGGNVNSAAGAGDGGYDYKTHRPQADNEIFSSNVSKMYLPPQ